MEVQSQLLPQARHHCWSLTSYLVVCVLASNCPQEPVQIHAVLQTPVQVSMAEGNGLCPCLHDFDSMKPWPWEQETAKEKAALGFQKR